MFGSFDPVILHRTPCKYGQTALRPSFCPLKTFNKTRIEIWNLFHFNCWNNKKSEFILLNLVILNFVSSQWLALDIENGRYGKVWDDTKPKI